MSCQLPQRDVDDLSAYLDGELPPARSAEVARLIRQEPAWAEALREMQDVDAALDAYAAPAPPADLAERIVAGVRAAQAGGRLADSDLEDLSACLDGELPPERLAEVQRLIRDDPAWQAAHRELVAVDAALEAYTAPAAPADLSARIVRHSRRAGRRSQALRLAAWLAPAAAAAAVILIALAWFGRPHGPQPPKPVLVRTPAGELDRSRAYRAVPKDERQDFEEEIVRHLSFFRDYEVLEEFETLAAIDQLEKEGT